MIIRHTCIWLIWLFSASIICGCSNDNGSSVSAPPELSPLDDLCMEGYSLWAENTSIQFDAANGSKTTFSQRETLLMSYSLCSNELERIRWAEELVNETIGPDSSKVEIVYSEFRKDSIYQFIWYQRLNNDWQSYCSQLNLRNYLVYRLNLDGQSSNISGTVYSTFVN